MGAARVQSAVTTNSATSVSAALTTGSVDNIVVALVYVASATGISETSGEGWTLVASEAHNSNRTVLVYAKQATAGVDTVTISRSPAVRISIHIFEVSGVDLDDVVAGLVEFDPDSSPATSSNTLSIGPLDPASTDDVLFLVLAAQNGSNGGTTAFDNSFTKHHDDAVARSFSGSRVITDPGSTSTTASWTTNQQRSGVLVALPSAAGGTVAGSQATETDTAQAGTAAVTVAGAQATETDTGAGGAPDLRIVGAQAAETDTGAAGAAAVTVAGAQATETDTGAAGAAAVTVAGSQATETDTTNAGTPTSSGGGTTVNGSQATETDTPAGGAPTIRIAGSQAVETDTPAAGVARIFVLLLVADPETGVDSITAEIVFDSRAALDVEVPVAAIPASLGDRFVYLQRKSQVMPTPTLVDGIPQ